MNNVKSEKKTTYEKPAVVYRQLMETVAGSCDPGTITNGKAEGESTCQQTSS